MKKTSLAVCILAVISGITPLAHANTPQQHENEANYDYLDDEFGDDQFGDFYGSDEFISIATGTQQAIDKAPAVASVITAEQIKQSGARNLIDALKMVPGLHVSRSSQIMSPKFNFRGITSTYSPQTLLMLNGVPTKSAVRGDNHTIWGEYPINSISRIEIIRGPGSALYGADAFAGVINIITKNAGELANTELGAGTGSDETFNGWLQTGTALGELKLGLSMEYLVSDGSDEIIAVDAQFPLDALAADFAGLPAVSYAPGSTNLGFEALDLFFNAEINALRFGFSFQDRSNVGTGQGATEALDPNGKFGGEKLMLDLVYETDALVNNWKFKAHLNYYHSEQEIEENLNLFPPGTLFGSFPDGLIGNPGWKEDTTNFEIRADYSGITDHNITLGAGYVKQDLYEVTETKNFFPDLTPIPEGIIDVSDTPDVFMPEFDRNSKFLLVQDIWQLAPDWELTTGIRYDDYSDFGSTVNPRLALIWSSSLKSTTKFLYGKAFRAPSFAEILTVNNPVALGNPDIEPETIDSLELAYSFRHSDRHTSSVNIFYYKIEDFITFVPDDGAPTATAQNVGERTGYGLEVETGFDLSERVSLKANYSYVKAEDDLINDDVGDYPNHQLKSELLWQVNPSWYMVSSINLVGKRERTFFDPRDALNGYTDTSINLNYSPDNHWNLSLAINNLFNDDIREPSIGPGAAGGTVNIPHDLPLSGRNLFLKATFKL